MRYSHSILLLIMLALSAGCFEYRRQGDFGDYLFNPRKIIGPEYRGLENKTIAILVDVDPSLLRHYPLLPLEAGRGIGAQIVGTIPGAQVVEPQAVVKFQHENLYWTTMTCAELSKKSALIASDDREITEFRLNEPGDPNLWRGVVASRVSIAEADSDDPDNLAYGKQVNVAHPELDRPSMVKAEERAMRMTLLDKFATKATNLFREHEEYIELGTSR